MSEPTEDEARDWRDLTQSPGWARLKTYAAQSWNAEAVQRHVELALDGADATALGKLRQIMAARRAVYQLIAHAEAKRPRPEETQDVRLGRRGAL